MSRLQLLARRVTPIVRPVAAVRRVAREAAGESVRTRARGRAPSRHRRALPVHLTLRATEEIHCLREPAIYPAVRDAIAASARDDFRVIQFSVQSTHVHLIAECDDRRALSRGVQLLAAGITRRLNRLLQRRGTLWARRYHLRTIRNPREMRIALAYVLNNFRKHLGDAQGVDPCSSGPWFSGWRVGPAGRVAWTPDGPSPVKPPRTWLARVAWMRHGGFLGLEEGPAAAALHPADTIVLGSRDA